MPTRPAGTASVSWQDGQSATEGGRCDRECKRAKVERSFSIRIDGSLMIKES